MMPISRGENPGALENALPALRNFRMHQVFKVIPRFGRIHFKERVGFLQDQRIALFVLAPFHCNVIPDRQMDALDDGGFSKIVKQKGRVNP